MVEARTFNTTTVDDPSEWEMLSAPSSSDVSDVSDVDMTSSSNSAHATARQWSDETVDENEVSSSLPMSNMLDRRLDAGDIRGILQAVRERVRLRERHTRRQLGRRRDENSPHSPIRPTSSSRKPNTSGNLPISRLNAAGISCVVVEPYDSILSRPRGNEPGGCSPSEELRANVTSRRPSLNNFDLPRRRQQEYCQIRSNGWERLEFKQHTTSEWRASYDQYGRRRHQNNSTSESSSDLPVSVPSTPIPVPELDETNPPPYDADEPPPRYSRTTTLALENLFLPD